MPEDHSFPEPPRVQPTRELLLAQALDACIRAERQVPGSAQEIIAHQPGWAQSDLRRLVGLAGSLDAAATNAIISEDFREAARARLMQRTVHDTPRGERLRLGGAVDSPTARLSTFPSPSSASSSSGQRPIARRRRSRWLWRSSAGLLAAVLGVLATLTASASSLPGEPLYGLKQAQEELGVRLAADDQARALALLRLGDVRLDETARLLQQGRTDEAQVTTQLYDRVVERATTTLYVVVDVHVDASTGGPFESKLTQQQEQLQALMQAAPESARVNLREALVTTERGRARVADPRPIDGAAGSRGPGYDAQELPTTAEPLPVAVMREDPATPAPEPRHQPMRIVLGPTQPVGPAQPAGAQLAGQPSQTASRGELGATVTARAPEDTQATVDAGGTAKDDASTQGVGTGARQADARQTAGPAVQRLMHGPEQQAEQHAVQPVVDPAIVVREERAELGDGRRVQGSVPVRPVVSTPRAPSIAAPVVVEAPVAEADRGETVERGEDARAPIVAGGGSDRSEGVAHAGDRERPVVTTGRSESAPRQSDARARAEETLIASAGRGEAQARAEDSPTSSARSSVSKPAAAADEAPVATTDHAEVAQRQAEAPRRPSSAAASASAQTQSQSKTATPTASDKGNRSAARETGGEPKGEAREASSTQPPAAARANSPATNEPARRPGSDGEKSATPPTATPPILTPTTATPPSSRGATDASTTRDASDAGQRSTGSNTPSPGKQDRSENRDRGQEARD